MSSWEAGTFEGSARLTALRAATSTAEERVAWLEEMLVIAQESGHLQRVREAKQREVDELWARTG